MVHLLEWCPRSSAVDRSSGILAVLDNAGPAVDASGRRIQSAAAAGGDGGDVKILALSLMPKFLRFSRILAPVCQLSLAACRSAVRRDSHVVAPCRRSCLSFESISHRPNSAVKLGCYW